MAITSSIIAGVAAIGGTAASLAQSNSSNKAAKSQAEQQDRLATQQLDTFKEDEKKRNLRATATSDLAAKRAAQKAGAATGNRGTILTSPLGGVPSTNPLAKTILGG